MCRSTRPTHTPLQVISTHSNTLENVVVSHTETAPPTLFLWLLVRSLLSVTHISMTAILHKHESGSCEGQPEGRKDMEHCLPCALKAGKHLYAHLKKDDQLFFIFIFDMFFSPTGALKSYLRELPEPLMTTELYDEWIQASK